PRLALGAEGEQDALLLQNGGVVRLFLLLPLLVFLGAFRLLGLLGLGVGVGPGDARQRVGIALPATRARRVRRAGRGGSSGRCPGSGRRGGRCERAEAATAAAAALPLLVEAEAHQHWHLLFLEAINHLP